MFAIWTIFGVIAFFQYYSTFEGKHWITLAGALQLGLGNAWLKAALSLPVLWALLRFNAKQRRWPSRFVVYALLFLVFTTVHSLLRPVSLPLYGVGMDVSQWTYWQKVLTCARSFTLDNALAFALTAAGFHAWRYAAESRVRGLREEALRAQLANAELSLLKMQLQPHFLFNTLNAIHCLAPEDSGKAQQMIERLSLLLRLSLDRLATNVVPLSRELEFLDAYLAIESTRFGERLQVVRKIDREALVASVPSMMLQPLVENAIRHGVGKLAGGGTVTIAAEKAGDRLTLCITNDYRPSGGNGGSSGLGLANTRARLTQTFGNNFSVRLEKRPREVRLTISVPFRPISEEQAIEEGAWSR
ncbi:MAG TPA: histidine kinase [Terriglobales bacterium]|nr:histidine kinase [Terriglobales bacterium]